MTDFYLRADDEEAMLATLEGLPTEGVTTDILGVVYREVSEEVFEPVPGYFANVRSNLPLGFPAVEVIYPETPWRVFAD